VVENPQELNEGFGGAVASQLEPNSSGRSSEIKV